jgi:uncharacterized membrane protein
MEGLLVLCIGLIGYLFYRTNGQKHQLSTLQSQLYKLQQQFIQLQQSIVTPDVDEVVQEEVINEAAVEEPPAKETSAVNHDVWRAEPNKAPAPKFAAQPTAIEQGLGFIINLAKNYFSQGNQIVRIGIIVLFFGMSFLAKYSIENSLISIEVRMAAILIAAMIMLGIGWHLRIKKPAYGLMMQGGGIAISYIAIFTSFKMYQLLPAEMTFPLLILFSIFAMSLAVLQDSKALAVTAITGGFAAPILASTGQGSHVGLFSYYLVLNCAIFFVAWFKSWRLLNVIGFLFTFIVASIWGVTQYRSADFASTEPFLIAFFLIYVAISILFAIKQKPELKGYVDGTLVFGVPMVGFGLQTALVHHMEYGLAYSAAALAGFYLLVTAGLRKAQNPNFDLLAQAMMALGIIFATLTIPFALDGRWTAASWAIEGAGFVWIALRQGRDFLKYVGLGIQLVGGLLFLADYPYRGDVFVFLNAEFMGIAIITLSALFSAYLLQTTTSEQRQLENSDAVFKQTLYRAMNFIDGVGGVALIVWGLGWWYIGALIQVDDHVARQYELTSYVAFLAASAGLWLLLSLRGSWQQFNFFPWLLLLPLCLYFWPTIFEGHFLEDYGYISWPLALLTLYGLLYKTEQEGYVLRQPVGLHSISYLLTLCIVAYELAWLLDDAGLATAWSAVTVMAVMIIALHLISNHSQRWPFVQYSQAYQSIAAPIILGLMLIWSVVFNFISILKPEPIGYMPLFNPIDLIQLLAVWMVIRWFSAHSQEVKVLKTIDVRWVLAVLAGFVFIWFNVLLLKSIHVIASVPYNPHALFDSAIVQTSISIAWTLIGLAVMILASNKAIRQLWIVGALLTGIVVAKLFLLDLSGQGTIERIVSFLVVGFLLLVVGYFSPVPPTIKAAEDTELKGSEGA